MQYTVGIMNTAYGFTLYGLIQARFNDIVQDNFTGTAESII